MVVAGGTAVAQRIGQVDASAVSIHFFEVAFSVVLRTRPGEGVQQVETVTGTVLQLGLKTVVGEESVWESFFDSGEGWNGTTCCHAEASR